MLKAIEWRTVFGPLLIIIGVFGSMLFAGNTINPHISTGVIATTFPIVSAALILKLNGVPVRATLMLISLPIGFFVSLLLAYNGSVDTQFFQGSIAASITGGLFLLCGYKEKLTYTPSSSPIHTIAIAAIIAISAPLFIVSYLHSEVKDLMEYWHPPEMMASVCIIVGLALSQDKSKDQFSKYQFATCYGAVLATAVAIVMNIQIYDDFWILKTKDVTIDTFVSIQLISLVSLVYGTAFYLIVVLTSIARNKTNEIMLKNWHFSEAYMFLTFMIIAPQSIYETIAGAAG
ncbi:hypothetical protein N9K70_06620 [Pseudomonadales bacterium]|nr:hypothetical protein [Pseudomonadales bacterium]